MYLIVIVATLFAWGLVAAEARAKNAEEELRRLKRPVRDDDEGTPVDLRH